MPPYILLQRAELVLRTQASDSMSTRVACANGEAYARLHDLGTAQGLLLSLLCAYRTCGRSFLLYLSLRNGTEINLPAFCVTRTSEGQKTAPYNNPLQHLSPTNGVVAATILFSSVGLAATVAASRVSSCLFVPSPLARLFSPWHPQFTQARSRAVKSSAQGPFGSFVILRQS